MFIYFLPNNIFLKEISNRNGFWRCVLYSVLWQKNVTAGRRPEARELTQYSWFKGLHMRYMGLHLIRGGNRLIPDSELHENSDLTQILKRIPSSVFVVFIFDQLPPKWTIFVAQGPGYWPPIILRQGMPAQLPTTNHQPLQRRHRNTPRSNSSTTRGQGKRLPGQIWPLQTLSDPLYYQFC